MKVKIGYLFYSVEFVDRMPEGHDHTDGVIDYHTQNICIKQNAGFTNEYTNFVFYHELAHGMLFVMGLDNHDESMADKLGHVLYQSLGDYKKLLIED